MLQSLAGSKAEAAFLRDVADELTALGLRLVAGIVSPVMLVVVWPWELVMLISRGGDGTGAGLPRSALRRCPVKAPIRAKINKCHYQRHLG